MEARDAGDGRGRSAEEEDHPRDRQELALISVKELQERIALLREEIERLEADIRKKEASGDVADQFFKK